MCQMFFFSFGEENLIELDVKKEKLKIHHQYNYPSAQCFICLISLLIFFYFTKVIFTLYYHYC